MIGHLVMIALMNIINREADPDNPCHTCILNKYEFQCDFYSPYNKTGFNKPKYCWYMAEILLLIWYYEYKETFNIPNELLYKPKRK